FALQQVNVAHFTGPPPPRLRRAFCFAIFTGANPAKRVSAKQDGAQGRNRTTDTVIFSHVLYQLSYLGIRVFGGERAVYRGSPGGFPERANWRRCCSFRINRLPLAP